MVDTVVKPLYSPPTPTAEGTGLDPANVPVRIRGRRPHLRRYGPYKNRTGHWFYVDVTRHGRRSVPLHRDVMERYLGRKLEAEEVVHHKDGNKDNNAVSNLEVKDRRKHTSDHQAPAETVSITCAWCGSTAHKPARYIRHNQGKQKKRGPFCGKRCAGSWTRQEQLSSGRRNLRTPRTPMAEEQPQKLKSGGSTPPEGTTAHVANVAQRQDLKS